MSISIIIPTYNPGAAAVGKMCAALAQQKTSFAELVIIDSSSSDGTADLWRSSWWHAAEQYQHHAAFMQTSISPTDFNHGRTRNQAAQLASGEVLVFLSQDALPQDGYWLGALTDPLTQASEAAIAGAFARQIAPADAPAKERFARAFNYPDTPCVKCWSDMNELGIKTFFFSNVASALQRDAFEEVGGFPDTILNEDMLIAAKLLRAGYAVQYAAKARVWHGHDYSIHNQFKRYFDIGVSLARARHLPPRLSSSSEGWRFVRGQLAFVRTHEGWHALPDVIAEAAAKWWGFKLGQNEHLLPTSLKRRLSMHRAFWDSPNPAHATSTDNTQAGNTSAGNTSTGNTSAGNTQVASVASSSDDND
jgi:rhamnosyltransferase